MTHSTEFTPSEAEVLRVILSEGKESKDDIRNTHFIRSPINRVYPYQLRH